MTNNTRDASFCKLGGVIGPSCISKKVVSPKIKSEKSLKNLHFTAHGVREDATSFLFRRILINDPSLRVPHLPFLTRVIGDCLHRICCAIERSEQRGVLKVVARCIPFSLLCEERVGQDSPCGLVGSILWISVGGCGRLWALVCRCLWASVGVCGHLWALSAYF